MFESIEEMSDIKLTLEEILLELNDVGFFTSVRIGRGPNMMNVLGYIPAILIFIPGKIFKINTVKETFLRIEDYLSSLGECKFDYRIESNYATYDYQMSTSEISPGQNRYAGFESDKGKDLAKRFNEISQIELFGHLIIK